MALGVSLDSHCDRGDATHEDRSPSGWRYRFAPFDHARGLQSLMVFSASGAAVLSPYVCNCTSHEQRSTALPNFLDHASRAKTCPGECEKPRE